MYNPEGIPASELDYGKSFSGGKTELCYSHKNLVASLTILRNNGKIIKK